MGEKKTTLFMAVILICGIFFLLQRGGLPVIEWERVTEQDSVASDVSLCLKQNRPIDINSYEDISLVLTSEADVSRFYFPENISLQKKVDGAWCFLSDGRKSDKQRDSAYDPCILDQGDKIAITVSLEKLLPWQLREAGEYRLCLPVYSDENGDIQIDNVYAEFFLDSQ